jgi:hypothetical protein
VSLEEAWEKAVQWTLALGFSGADLDVFSTASTACITALREAAHSFIVQHLGMLHPRARLEVYRKAAGVLPGFTRRDAAGEAARELFDEALLEAVTASSAAQLVELVEALTGPGSAAGEAG